VTAVALLGAVVLLGAVAGLAWTAHLLHIGTVDALELASKVAVPKPASALDWPELRVRAVVPQPDESGLVLLLVGWPAQPRQTATLLVALDSDDRRSVPTLAHWCATRASVSPTRLGAAGIELRRRQTLDRVRAVQVAEDNAPNLV
jgi:hypothetical protein